MLYNNISILMILLRPMVLFSLYISYSNDFDNDILYNTAITTIS